MSLKPAVIQSSVRFLRTGASVRSARSCFRHTCRGFRAILHSSREPERNDQDEFPYITFTKKYQVLPLPLHHFGERSSRLPKLNDNELQVFDVKRNDYVSVSARWIRDNCTCSHCRNPETGQRQINVLKGDINCKISEVRALSDNANFEVTFADGHCVSCTAHSLFPRPNRRLTYQRGGVARVKTWEAHIASAPPSVQYENIRTEGVGWMLNKIRQFGFCFVEDIPANPEATQGLLEMIGPIRNTHYGGFYDFTSDLASKDTAYTSESLEPHTDNTYFTEPAGLQALHLLSHTDGVGGENSLVDGFGAAAKLFKQDRKAYHRLTRTPIHAHASGNEGISIQPSQPVPVLTHHSESLQLIQVRWNNADRAGVSHRHQEMEEWYDAAAKFDALISDPENQYWFQLRPGRLLIFDNWRVLHGRSAFTGKRRMCGGYINRDDFISKYRMTNLSKEEIRASTVTG